MTKAPRKPPVRKPVSKEKEALEILSYIVDNVDDYMYNELCSQGQEALRKAAKLVGKENAFVTNIVIGFDSAIIQVADHADDDAYEAVVRITNKRTKQTYETVLGIDSWYEQ
jgi:hypothetical protein